MLGRAIGTWQAAFFSFAIGTIALALIAALAKGGLGQIAEARHADLVLPHRRAARRRLRHVRARDRPHARRRRRVAATIAGQLAISVVVDHFGWLGVGKQPIDAARVIGIALLAAGTYLVVRD